MSQRTLLMPKATAVWLVENTALTFEQIAELCNLHVLEVKGIADNDVAQGIRGLDPISSGQLSREEIKRGEEDPDYRLSLAEPKVNLPQVATRKKGPRYTPVSRRHDRPNAVLWLLRNHPELKDSQIIRLVGTTKPTIAQIRDRTHWNSQNLVPQDPVTLGLCSQIDLDAEVKKAAKRTAKDREGQHQPDLPGGTLLPVEETTAVPGLGPQPDFEPTAESERAEEARMFARLQQLPGASDQPDVPDEEYDAETVFAKRAPAPKPDEQPEAVFAGDHGDESGGPDAGDDDEYGIGLYTASVDPDVVKAIVRFCGIALRSSDGSLVSCSSKDELDRVRESWLKKKLKLGESHDDATLDGAIAEVCEMMKETRRKHRVVFYYLLAEKLDQLDALKG